MNTEYKVKLIGRIPQYIDADDFPKGTQRSTKGSLHLIPNNPRIITKDELEYIKSTSIFNKDLRVIEEIELVKEIKKSIPIKHVKTKILVNGKDSIDGGNTSKKKRRRGFGEKET